MISLTTTTRRLWLLMAIVTTSLLGSVHGNALEEHTARGVVLTISADKREVEISCDEIPGYMAAMAMPFTVRDARSLDDIKPGMAIRFTIVTKGKSTYAENIQPAATQSFDSEPMEAGSLTALNSIKNPAAAQREVAVGEKVPDFALIDQTGKQVRLSQLKGKVVALTF